MAMNSGEGFDGDFVESLDKPGFKVFERRRRPSGAVRAGVLICHGYSGQTAWFWELARELCEKVGTVVHAIDLPSHGKTDDVDGMRGYVRAFDDYVVEAVAALDRLDAATPEGAPLIILGESMGSLVVLRTYMRPGIADRVRGVILCGSVITQPTVLPPAPVLAMIKVLARVFPLLPTPSNDVYGDSFDRAFGDPEAAKLARTDPLNLFDVPLRIGMVVSFMNALADFQSHMGGLSFQNLAMLHYEGDERAPVQGCEDLIKAASSSGVKELVRLPGKNHQIFQDLPENRAQHIAKVCEFVQAFIS